MSKHQTEIDCSTLEWILALGYLLGRHCAHVWHDNLVDERTESQPEIGRQTLHALHQELPQFGQLVLVVLHRLGKIHQVIQIDWVIFSLGTLQRQIIDFI